ncbi:methionyl-tRNA formyltransferase [Hujiaoplasma nucleasis]|uniref:Methionyl-tRNA formyltransferase n=1 Tax=Hujiaoplasma nucleasis TaxID=2725268 RepID=A0A7L6N4X0_9MOLU|nr:methionyl-tRNA formyltransferase [Hujiaoplasma nucleasis]QLY40045.1 methionyl-tRNA formyltransferase [Hujiaoplasma nucleasis]
MKVCFMGSMDFAVKILEELNKKFEVDLVVTQPDKPVGRKKILQGTPVKNKALELGLKTFQPENIKNDYQCILQSNYDFMIVAAYGQIIPDIVLNHARFKAINVHASLLPKYRGGTPMHRAIMNGDKETGVSIMYMVRKMDAGPVLAQESLVIEDNDDVGSLEMKLADLGSKLLIKTLDELILTNLQALAQNPEDVTYAYHIKDEEKIIDLKQPAKVCYDLVRGLHPWPIAEMLINGQKLKVYKADYQEISTEHPVGQVVDVNKNGVYIQTGKGLLILKEVQLQGKKRMDIQAFMNGLGKDIFKLNTSI